MSEPTRTALRRQELRRKIEEVLDEWRYHPRNVDDALDRIMDLIGESHVPWSER